MSICRKCGGRLQGDNCPRHGSQHKPQPSFRSQQPVTQPHSPFSPETDRRVFAMIGVECKGCQLSCGDLERCPMLRARWFGDSPEETQQEEPERVEVLSLPLPEQKPGFQMSLF